MGWDSHNFDWFTVLTDSHGGARERLSERKLEQLKEDIKLFIDQIESDYDIPGIICIVRH